MLNSLPTRWQPNMCQYGWVIAHFYFCSTIDIPVIPLYLTLFWLWSQRDKIQTDPVKLYKMWIPVEAPWKITNCHNNTKCTKTVIWQMCHSSAVYSLYALFHTLDRCFLCVFDNWLTWQQILLMWIHVGCTQPGCSRLHKMSLTLCFIFDSPMWMMSVNSTNSFLVTWPSRESCVCPNPPTASLH